MRTIKLPTGLFEFDPARSLGKRGGFGQVFWGITQDGKEIAVKKLHLSASEAAHRELRVADELRGSNFQYIIPFIDAGMDADTGDYFTIMPKADRSLQDKIDQDKSLSSYESISILLQIVNGLLEVDGLVHRDLKPDNILFHEGKWKIADFGIARFIENSTSTNTLKDCLSPYYAAPEQWRFERSTHATDIYAIGCIAFCLLSGAPPFKNDPQYKHQNTPIPSLNCSDPRLYTLLNMCLRKIADSRPSLVRVRNLLAEIENNHFQEKNNAGLNALAHAAADVSSKEQEEQTKLEAEKIARAKRLDLTKFGREILYYNVNRLWEKIHSQAPNAIRQEFLAYILDCKLGQAKLQVDAPDSVGSAVFHNSGWDVLSYAKISVEQPQHPYIWSASLWFSKLKNHIDYRWYEASYFTLFAGNSYEPHAEIPGKNADLAASNIMNGIQFAFGPIAVDDEGEDDFHERWIWLLAKATSGQLRRPHQMPFKWPPF
jgi:serine/threonine-protein kinase